MRNGVFIWVNELSVFEWIEGNWPEKGKLTMEVLGYYSFFILSLKRNFQKGCLLAVLVAVTRAELTAIKVLYLEKSVFDKKRIVYYAYRNIS